MGPSRHAACPVLSFGEKQGVDYVYPAQDAADNGKQDRFIAVPGDDDGDDGAKTDAGAIIDRLVIEGVADGADDTGGEQQQGQQEKRNIFDRHNVGVVG